MDSLGDSVTQGGWSIFKHILVVLVKVNAMMLMVFIRKRMGITMFSFGLLFWAGPWNWLALLIASENWRALTAAGMTAGHQPSQALILGHGTAFGWFMIVKWIIAGLTLGSSSPRWQRPRISVGESVVYPVVRWAFHRIGIMDNEIKPGTWWKINHQRWILLWEPVLLLFIAALIKGWGYTAYGNYLIIATLCLAYFTFQANQTTARMRQAEIDARDFQGEMHPPSRPRGKRHVISDK